jgi:hypothetical protein
MSVYTLLSYFLVYRYMSWKTLVEIEKQLDKDIPFGKLARKTRNRLSVGATEMYSNWEDGQVVGESLAFEVVHYGLG